MTKMSACPGWRPGTSRKWMWFCARAITGAYPVVSKLGLPTSVHANGVPEEEFAEVVMEEKSRKKSSPAESA